MARVLDASSDGDAPRGHDVTKRNLRYHEEERELPDGTTETVYVPRERASTYGWRWTWCGWRGRTGSMCRSSSARTRTWRRWWLK